MITPEQDWDQEWEDMQPLEMCPKCGRQYDDIDFDYQICSKCGWDSEKGEWTKPRQPKDVDYLNGDADILTGGWNY
jgi:ribosomal protein L37AE/L43A